MERPDEAIVSSHASLVVQNAGSLTEKANVLVRPRSDSTQMVAVRQVGIKCYTKQFDGMAVLWDSTIDGLVQDGPLCSLC